VPDVDVGPPLQGVSRVESSAEDSVGKSVGGDGKEEEPVHDLGSPCRRRYSQAVLDFLSTTDVGRLAPAEEGAGVGWGIGVGVPGA